MTTLKISEDYDHIWNRYIDGRYVGEGTYQEGIEWLKRGLQKTDRVVVRHCNGVTFEETGKLPDFAVR